MDDMTLPILGAIIFENFEHKQFLNESEIIEYTVRLPSHQRTAYQATEDRQLVKSYWMTDRKFLVSEFPGPRIPTNPHGGFPGYFDEGFLYLQYAVDKALTNLLINSTQRKIFNEFSLQIQRFPFPPYVHDFFLFFVHYWAVILIPMAFMYTVMTMTWNIVDEKSKRLQEYQKILGIPSWLLWVTWFVRAFLGLLLTTLVTTFILTTRFWGDYGLLENSNPVVIFLLFAAYAYSLIGFSFFMSTLFDQPDIASLVTGLSFILQAFTYIKFYWEFDGMSWESLFWNCFLAPSSPMTIAVFFLASFESTTDGAQFGNLWEGIKLHSPFSMGQVMTMMILNGSLFLLLAFYIELAFPGKFGSPLPLHFPFTRWFWTGRTKSKKELQNLKSPPNEKVNLKPGVELCGVGKVFGKKVVLQEVTFKVYPNEVTTLVGQNGTGKTTLLSILAGLIRPSSGKAWVGSVEVGRGVRQVGLGFCPQYNILFDHLTVEEHLQFYCILKGTKKEERRREIERLLHGLDLNEMRHVQTQALSGGTKRKLSVAISFSGNAKVVLLDEPTAGMDIWTRRSAWEFLMGEKMGKTIIMSTHDMEEVDHVGDRIAIMANGHLQCCASNGFLKQKYGEPTKLILRTGEGSTKNKLRTALDKLLPFMTFNEEKELEIVYSFPTPPNSNDGALVNSLKSIESHMTQLGVKKVDVQEPTMEQVFLQVARTSKSSDISLITKPAMPKVNTKKVNDLNGKNEGLCLWLQQGRGLLTKELLVLYRNPWMTLAQVQLIHNLVIIVN